MEPDPLYWLVEKGSDPVTADISFLLKTGDRLGWEYNGLDLLDELASLEVTLVDGDWQPEGEGDTVGP